MKQISLMLLLGVMLVITGCPLNTEKPVDEGSYTATGWLTGKWIGQKANGTKGNTYIVEKGDKPGNIRVYAVTDGKRAAKPRPVVLSSIGNKIFISAYEEGDEVDDSGYYIMLMVKKGNNAFDLMPVKEHSISSGSTSKEIRDWLTANADGDIYVADEVEHYKKG